MSSKGVLHLQGGGLPEIEGTRIAGIDIRAEVMSRIAWVFTLITIRLTPRNHNYAGDLLPFNSFLYTPEPSRPCVQERVHVR